MEILAGLVRLIERNVLPAPWFNRPSLGLVTNTPVNIGVLKAAHPTDAPPDIIVTPLRTDRMHYTTSVVIDLKERPGAVYEVLNQLQKDFNIALAETVTIDQRTRHQITLLLEPPEFYDGISNVEIERHQERLLSLRSSVEKLQGFDRFTSNPAIDQNTEFEFQATSVVDQGMIACRTIRDWILRKYVGDFKDRFDFSRVVVSSSADGRFIRYIFPKRGVFEATVSHLERS